MKVGREDAAMSQVNAYKRPAVWLHWLTALLVFLTIPAAVIMLQPGIERGLQDPLFVFHKNVGVVIFVLVALRLIYRLLNPPPPLPESVPTLQRLAAETTHWLLYVLLLVMTISGYVRVTAGGFPLEGLDALGVPRFLPRSDELANTAKAVHSVVRIPLVLLIFVHIGAALYHGIIRRDGVLARMIPAMSKRA
jgi:cytochrome b561